MAEEEKTENTDEELKKKIASDPFEDQNAATMAEIVSDPCTSEFVKLQILNTLLSVDKEANFFEAMYKNEMTLCRCPHCESQIHWLIPEDDLNMLGYVTAEHVENVKVHTTEKDCSRYAEACGKKRVSG